MGRDIRDWRLGTGDSATNTDDREPHGRVEGSPTHATTGDTLGAAAVSRRGFLGVAAAGIAATLIPKFAESLVPSPQSLLFNSPQPIGLQLYTVRDLMQKDVKYTLQQVAGVGYREVEFAGLFDKNAKTVAKWLGENKLTSPSSHIPLDRLKNSLQGVVDECQTLGNGLIVCPWIDESLRKSADDWHKIAADLNKIGEQLSRMGLRFAYHNHDFEFKKLASGEMGYDILLKECDPKFVKMEMDLYWITKGGQDPLAYFAKWPGRFPLVHVKDMTGSGEITNVGKGTIDWNRIFAKRREAGIEHFYVERDNPTSPIDDIKVSYDYLSRLGL
jgi:sugar phosphate isomerase/epimerase